MIKIILFITGCVFLVPFISYLVGKYATLGHLEGMRNVNKIIGKKGAMYGDKKE